jgi:hypothetical protein
MVTEHARLRLADDATFQTLGPGNDTVILSLRSGFLYTCNATTAAFLQALDGRRALGDVVDRMLDDFDVPRDRLARDLLDLSEKLLSESLLVESAT